MKRRFLKLLLVTACLSSGLILRGQTLAVPPIFSNISLTANGLTTVNVTATVTELNITGSYPKLFEWGFCFSTDSALINSLNAVYDNDKIANVIYKSTGLSQSGAQGLASFSYSGVLTGLNPNTTYYIKGYALNDSSPNIGYSGSVITVKTLSGLSPTVNTTNSASITNTTALLSANVVAAGDGNVNSRGFEVSVNSSFTPGTVTTITAVSTGLGAYTVTVTSLSTGSTYYFRAYAQSNIGTAYGQILSFTTLASIAPTPPVVITSPATSVTSTSFILSGGVTSEGTSAVSERGFELSPTSNFATKTKYTAPGVGLGGYTLSLTNAQSGVIYYYRAYAISAIATASNPAYGAVVSVTTLPAIALPVVTTSQINASSSAPTLSGAIQGGDNTSITNRGFRVGLNSDLKNYSTYSSSTPIAALNIVVSGLEPGVWYFYRAFATNAQGTGLGDILAFKMYGTNSGSLSIINASTRASANSGASALITGIVLSGSGTASFVARGVGPTLTAFGVAGSMIDPGITVYGSTGQIIGYNDNWDSRISSLFQSLGAFMLNSGGRDATVPVTLGAGSYTFNISPVTGSSGVTLAELYKVK
jgi:hypothetical protein